MQRPTVVPCALELGFVLKKLVSYNDEFWNFMMMQCTVEWRIIIIIGFLHYEHFN